MFHYLSTTPLLPLGCSPGANKINMNAQSKLETCRRLRVLRAMGPRQATFVVLERHSALLLPFWVCASEARRFYEFPTHSLRIPYEGLTTSLRALF